jgi:hypothetical protein
VYMQAIQVRVVSNGTVEIREGYWYWTIAQDGEISRSKEKFPREKLAGHFSVKVPDKFSVLDFWGASHENHELMLHILAKARDVAGIKMRRKK